QAEDGIRDLIVTGVQTCALPISACGCQPTRRKPPEPCGRGRMQTQAAAGATGPATAPPPWRNIAQTCAAPRGGRHTPLAAQITAGRRAPVSACPRSAARKPRFWYCADRDVRCAHSLLLA